LRRGRSLSTRLVAAMVLLSVVVLGLSYATTYVLVRRELQDNALSNLRSRQADLRPVVVALAESSTGTARGLAPRLRRLKNELRAGLQVTGLNAALVGPAGTIRQIGADPVFALPDGIPISALQPDALYAAQSVSGRHGNTVFLAFPARMVGRQRLVIIATDQVETNVLSRATPLLLLAGLIVLLFAIGIAVWLARRLTRSIREIERAAAQLASGDLSGRADVPPGTDADLADLGDTLNAMAAQLEQSRGSQRAFLLSVSHDLRTPLTSIRGYAEALADGTLDDADPEARKRAAGVITAESRRLERLVRDLLDLSRLDSREFSLNPRPCDLAELVRDATAAFAPQAKDLGIELHAQAGAPFPVDLDPERVAQIVANLVENALKYATTTIQVYATHSDAGRVAIVVADDGPGIPPEDFAHVFERLYTVRTTPARSVGTGLGLAIVRELATAMGGTAAVETPPEGGTRFVVTLPANRTGVNDARVTPASDAGSVR
jgi:two-component system, OmpR family, sensor kinase